MVKTYVTIEHDIVAAPVSGNSALKTAIQAIPDIYGTATFPIPTWLEDGSFLKYTSWDTKMYWDAINKKLVEHCKQHGSAVGALHFYDAATDTWSEPWRGYAGSASGHTYNGWAVDPTTGRVWFEDWDGGNTIKRWQGAGNTNAAWEDIFDPVTSSNQTPHAIDFIPNWFGTGETGLIRAERQSATGGGIFVSRLDGTDETRLFTGTTGANGTEAMSWYEPNISPVPYLNGVLVTAGGEAWPKISGSPYTSPEARSGTVVCGMWLLTGTQAAPIIKRLPDPPSTAVVWSKGITSGIRYGDKVIAYNDVVYLFGQADKDIWTLNLQTGTAWVKLSQSHGFDPGNFNNNTKIVAIPEYGGIVAMNNSITTGSEDTSARPGVYLFKVEALSGGGGSDTVPNPFSFGTVSSVAFSSVQTSNTITVAGIDASATVTITGGEYSKNGGAYTSSSGSALVGNTFAVRHTASASGETSTTTTLTIGGVSGTFTSVTVGTDPIPDIPTFTAQTNVALSTVVQSNTITLAGLNAPTQVVVLSGLQYSKNGAAFTGSVGTAVSGDTIQLQMTSSVAYGTARNLTVYFRDPDNSANIVYTDWSVTTLAAPATNYWNFDSITVGESVTAVTQPSSAAGVTGWSAYSLSGSWTYGIVNDSAGASGNALRETAGATGTNAHHLIPNGVSSVDGTTQTIEVLCRWMARAGESAPTRPPVGLMMNTTDDAGYTLDLIAPSSIRFIRLGTTGSTAATFGISSPAEVWAAGTWYWTRFRRETDGTFRVRVWAGNLAAEPAIWNVSASNTAILAGYPAIIGYSHSQEKDVDTFSYAVNGTAPSS